MRAVLSSLDGPSAVTVAEEDDPDAAEGQLVARVEAAALEPVGPGDDAGGLSRPWAAWPRSRRLWAGMSAGPSSRLDRESPDRACYLHKPAFSIDRVPGGTSSNT